MATGNLGGRWERLVTGPDITQVCHGREAVPGPLWEGPHDKGRTDIPEQPDAQELPRRVCRRGGARRDWRAPAGAAASTDSAEKKAAAAHRTATDDGYLHRRQRRRQAASYS